MASTTFNNYQPQESHVTRQGELRELWSASYGPDAPGTNSQLPEKMDTRQIPSGILT